MAKLLRMAETIEQLEWEEEQRRLRALRAAWRRVKRLHFVAGIVTGGFIGVAVGILIAAVIYMVIG